MGIITSKNVMLYNYQQYNGNDIEYIKNYLYPTIFDAYEFEFSRNSVTCPIADEDDFKAYAKSLGATEDEATSFARNSAQDHIERIRYGPFKEGIIRFKEKRDGLNFNPIETLERYMGPDGQQIKAVKTLKEPDGKTMKETFGPDDKKIQAVTSFPDGKTIEETFGPDEKRIEAITSFKDQDENWVHIVEKNNTIQKYVGGQLVETIKSEQKENSSQNPTNSFQSTETPINSNANTATNSSPLLTFFKDHAAHTFPSENTTTNLVKLSHSSTNAPKPKESKPLSSIKTPKFFDGSR